MDFDEYQRQTNATDETRPEPWIGLAQSTFGLTEKVGQVTACLKKRIRDGHTYVDFTADLETALGDVLWYLSSVCKHLNISLDSVAKKNLAFTNSRWRSTSPQGTRCSPLLDETYPQHEQPPRHFIARFSERRNATRSWLPMTEVTIGSEAFGDPIDDNSPRGDHYRLHDALYLANAAVLGWSPVVRSLLKRKRKSVPAIDKYEDGARARDTEELLARLIHLEAEQTPGSMGWKRLTHHFSSRSRRLSRI